MSVMEVWVVAGAIDSESCQSSTSELGEVEEMAEKQIVWRSGADS